MSTAENKVIVRRYLKEAWDDGNVDVCDELLAPGFKSLNAPPGDPANRDSEKALIRMFLAAFGGFQSTFEDQVAEGDYVLSRWTAVGTHQAPFLGVPASGKVIKMKGTELARVTGGQIQDIHAIFDMVGLLQQLGVVPSPPGDPLPAPVPPTVADTEPTTPEQKKALLTSMIEDFWNDRKLDVVDTIVNPDATCPSAPFLPNGPEGFKVIGQIVWNAFPDFHMHIDRVLTEGDRVAALYTEHGTQSGDFMGIPPTNKSATWTEIAILRVANGQFIESWYETDQATMMQQLGLVPPPGGDGPPPSA